MTYYYYFQITKITSLFKVVARERKEKVLNMSALMLN